VRAWLVPLAVVAVVLLATVDDRHVGGCADERQIIWTAIAITETGQMAQARGHDFTLVTADGQAVSRYGIGMTLAQVPAALLAPRVEGWLGAGSSQPLFLLAPLLLVLAAAALAGVASLHLAEGANIWPTALVLCALGSPLGAYAAIGSSEALQAAALAGAYACALGSCAARDGRAATRRALLAGVFVSCAVLAKSSLLVVAPAALLPLLGGSRYASRTTRVARAVVGFVPGAALWLILDVVRFGRPFASYPGEGFTHPFVDGFWRLLVGPNTGFLLFFPAGLIVMWSLVRQASKRRWDDVLKMSGAVLPFFLLVCLASGWWAWHGVWGWGPRLIVPAVPLLAACAAHLMLWWPSWSRAALVAASIVINVPGLVQHTVPVTSYVSNLVWPQASAGFATSLAGYAWRLETGRYVVSPDHVLATLPQASPFVVYPWFFLATRSDDVAQVARALETPPWHGARPDLVPTVMPMTERFVRSITGYPRWHFWGRGFRPSAADVLYWAVYDEGLADQVTRLQQRREGAAALHLARKLVDLSPIGPNDALVLETYRILGDRPAAADYLSRLSAERRFYPDVNVVLALFERDAGNEAMARQFLDSVSDRYPADAPLQSARRQSLEKWPADLQSMIVAHVKSAGE
jgi:hypothetical protein